MQLATVASAAALLRHALRSDGTDDVTHFTDALLSPRWRRIDAGGALAMCHAHVREHEDTGVQGLRAGPPMMRSCSTRPAAREDVLSLPSRAI